LASKKPIYQPWAEIEELLDASSFLLFLSARSYTKLQECAEISNFDLAQAVSSIYIWSKNFSHLAYEKQSEAKMAAIDVQEL
jgi:hypothetical protein